MGTFYEFVKITIYAFRQITLFIALENRDMQGCKGSVTGNNLLDGIMGRKNLPKSALG
jgi:hypothetical protein